MSALKYRLCALPIGVSMLPVFAATVISAHTMIALSSMRAIVSTARPKGTKVSNATSFVMNIDEMNVSDNNVSTRPRAVCTRRSSDAPMILNTPMRWNPATTSIRQMSCAIVLTCTYPPYCPSGGTMKHEINASMDATINMVSLRMNVSTRCRIHPPERTCKNRSILHEIAPLQRFSVVYRRPFARISPAICCNHCVRAPTFSCMDGRLRRRRIVNSPK